MALLLTLAALLIAALLIGLGVYLGGRREALSRAEHRELIALRRTISDIDDLVWNQREVYPEVSTQIVDIIRTHRTKEIGR